tara:strand:- start:556 stop:753 length:198 start_codon:yes stop_codon:yes gene_type:complete
MDNINMNDEIEIKVSKLFMVNTIIHLSLESNHMSLSNVPSVRELYETMTIDKVKEDFERLKEVYK